MTTWLFLNSLGLAIVAGVLFLTLRQVGFVLGRVGPAGARSATAGPRVGENITYYLPPPLAADSSRKAKLLLLGSASCSICAHIREAAHELARSWKSDAEILLVYDCESDKNAAPPTQIATGLFFQRDCDLRERLGASFVPFAIVTDCNGIVVGKALVNELAHLESLLELERSRRLGSSARPTTAGVRRGATG